LQETDDNEAPLEDPAEPAQAAPSAAPQTDPVPGERDVPVSTRICLWMQ